METCKIAQIPHDNVRRAFARVSSRSSRSIARRTATDRGNHGPVAQIRIEGSVKRKPTGSTTRRMPQQRRARQTVEAILDAVVRVLKREGIAAVTTNRIAEVAGVSIGSVYQYFPDKRAIFTALHDRHIEDTARLIESALIDHAAEPLDVLVRALVGALVDAHGVDPELQELLRTEVPFGAGVARTFEERLRNAFRLAIASRVEERFEPKDLDRILFVVPLMVEALSHGVALRRPPRMSLAAAKEEAVRAVLAYLRS
jgi:AcrR family transcriptional regulator